MSNGDMDQGKQREPCAETAFSDIASPIVDEAIEQASNQVMGAIGMLTRF